MLEKMSRREGPRSRSGSHRTYSPSPIKDRSYSPGRKKRSLSLERRRRSRDRCSRDNSRCPSHSQSARRCRHKYSCSRSRSRSYSPSERKNYDRRKSTSRSPISQRRRHRHLSESPPQQSRCLGIFGLSVLTNEEKITEIFGKFGPIERVQVVIDAKTGRSRGFCFIYFNSIDDAKVAKEQCSGMEIDDRRIRVDYSITQRAHTPTPGCYMGKPTNLYRKREYHDRYRDEHRYKDRHSPSPYYRERKKRYEYRSRSRSYSPRERRYRY